MTDIGNGTGERFASNVSNLASHAEELMRSTSAVSSSTVAAARQKLNESLSKVRDQLVNVEHMALDSGKQAVTATQTYVRDNPWQAIAIGVLVGLTLGVLATSNRRRHSEDA